MKNVLFYCFIVTITILISCKETPKQESGQNEQITEFIKPQVQLVWETDTLLRTPESILYDKNQNLYFVSCINGVPPSQKDGDGYISKIDNNGKIIELKWIKNLNAPKGMGIIGDTLFVTDIDELVLISVKNSQIINRVKVPGSIFLNDIAVVNNEIYLSDTEANTIYQYKSPEIRPVLIEKDGISGPNGLLVNEGKLLVLSFTTGSVQTFNLSNWKQSEVNEINIPNGDGIEPYYEKGFLYSNWQGEVYYSGVTTQKQLLLDTKSSSRNAADIYFNKENGVLAVPEFFGNKVSGYKLSH